MSESYSMHFLRAGCFTGCRIPQPYDLLPEPILFLTDEHGPLMLQSQLHSIWGCCHVQWFRSPLSLFEAGLDRVGLEEPTIVEWHEGYRLAFSSIADLCDVVLGASHGTIDSWASQRFPASDPKLDAGRSFAPEPLAAELSTISEAHLATLSPEDRQLVSLFEYLPVNEMVPPREGYSEPDLWLLYLGPRLVKLYGREVLLSGPFFKVEERPTGAIVLDICPGHRRDYPSEVAWAGYPARAQRARQFLRLDEDWRGRYLEIRRKLGTPLSPG